MESQFLLLLLLLVLQSLILMEAQEIKSARLLDLVIRDYTFKSYTKNRNFRTGKLHRINLPWNLSGIHVDSVRLRCGSLRRYGVKIKEFHVSAGTRVRPCTSRRLMLIRQNLGSNWSSLYYNNYDLSGYELVSPVLGLFAYNAGNAAAELEIEGGEKPITIDFGGVAAAGDGIIPLCARFGEDGKVSVWGQGRAHVCVARGQGHYGVVVESPMMPVRREGGKWGMAVGGSIGAAVGVFLLGLLAVAVAVKAKKKKARMEEMERRAYEDEALQVSMVGHVRALTASGTRTMPTIQHHRSTR